MSFHIFKLIDKLNLTLKRILICIVQLLELMRVIKLDFLNVNLLQNHVINDELKSNLFRVSWICHVVRVSDTFFLTFEESAVSVKDRSNVTEVLKFKSILFIFLVSEVMMNQLDLVFDFDTFVNILLYIWIKFQTDCMFSI